MKKITLLAVVTIALTFNSFAQISAGGGITYGSKQKTIGFNLRGQYNVWENVDVVAGFTFYLPHKEKQTLIFTTIDSKTTMWSFDIDGHYNFELMDKLKAYPIAGLNISGVSVDVNGTKASDTEAGFNIGAGATYEITDKLAGLFEIKYTLGRNYDQAVIGIGVLYSF
jgi:outer membrane protein X